MLSSSFLAHLEFSQVSLCKWAVSVGEWVSQSVGQWVSQSVCKHFSHHRLNQIWFWWNLALSFAGVQNITALGNAITWQKVDYDFDFHQMEFPCNLNIVVTSEGKSLLPVRDRCGLILRYRNIGSCHLRPSCSCHGFVSEHRATVRSDWSHKLSLPTLTSTLGHYGTPCHLLCWTSSECTLRWPEWWSIISTMS